jgi:hypothetical protein
MSFDINNDPKRLRLSSRQWAEISNRNFRQGKMRSYLRSENVFDYNNGMPSSGMAKLAYLCGQGSLLHTLLRCVQSKKAKQLRRSPYMNENTAARQQLIHRISSHTSHHHGSNVFVAFGNAIFSQNSKGYEPGSNVRKFVDCLQKIDRVHVILTDEYHTSQVCSRCDEGSRTIYRTVGPGTEIDAIRNLPGANYQAIDNPWRLRICMECGLLDNRDAMASKHILNGVSSRLTGKPLSACFNREHGKLPYKQDRQRPPLTVAKVPNV